MGEHRDCEASTERGVCLSHIIGPYVAHCEVDAERWPCEIATLREALAASERERAALAFENEGLRSALIEEVKYDDGTFIQTYRRCRVCLWGERNTVLHEHQECCPLARDPGRHGREVLAAADILGSIIDEYCHEFHGEMVQRECTRDVCVRASRALVARPGAGGASQSNSIGGLP